MAQQFDYPKTETQLREIQDKLYQHSKEARDAGDRPAFILAIQAYFTAPWKMAAPWWLP